MVKKPEDHDWRDCTCTFTGSISAGSPVIGADGRIEKGDIKLSGVVVDHRYLGRSQKYGMIPDFEIDVRGKSGAVLKIGLLDNNFQVIK